DAVRPEQPHQVVFQRQEEHTLPGVALSARAAAQLPVDAPRLVPLGAHDHEAAGRVLVAAQLLDSVRREIRLLHDLAEGRLAPRPDAADLTPLDAGAELDVGAAASHVRGDGDRARL